MWRGNQGLCQVLTDYLFLASLVAGKANRCFKWLRICLSTFSKGQKYVRPLFQMGKDTFVYFFDRFYVVQLVIYQLADFINLSS